MPQRPNAIRLRPFTALAASCLLAFGMSPPACSRGGDAADDPAGVGSAVVALTVAPGVSLDSASFTITGSGGFSRAGSVDVSQSATLSFQVGGLSAGAGYSVAIGATLSDGATTCTGSADFAVTARSVTMVSVHVRCREPGRTGGVVVGGTINICPVVDSISANPAEVRVGGSIALAGAAHDTDAAPSPLTFTWSSGTGTISNVSSPNTMFTCTVAGRSTVTLTASDGDCTDAAVIEVTCSAGEGAGGTGGAAGMGSDGGMGGQGGVGDGGPDPGVSILFGSVWRYSDQGIDLGSAWRATTFDDSTWASGPAELGYGDGDEATVVSFGPSSTNKYITTYFRHTFSVSNPGATAALELVLRRDDGAVVYLNGTEVARSNMPTGAISFSTVAFRQVEDDDTFLFSVPPGLLVSGNNVIAVEVHQGSAGSSDLSFDLSLTGTAPAPLPGPDAGPGSDPDAGPGTSLLAVGDVGDCNSEGDTATSALLDAHAGTVLLLGDAAYPNGAPSDFSSCFDPVWGRHKERIRSVPGNHEYQTAGAAGYFGYFGAAAGDPARGYYSFDHEGWHIVALNTNCGVVGCAAGSEQEQWLRQDLTDHAGACTIAFSHHPRFSSGQHGNVNDVEPLWRALVDHGVEMMLSGHDHDYERWASLDGSGSPSPNGTVQFVVGTGGTTLRGFPGGQPVNSLARNSTWGVLKLTLRGADYDWEFLPVAGGSNVDRGFGRCH
jgi:hypothetical protein